jgi:hypothetical protein
MRHWQQQQSSCAPYNNIASDSGSVAATAVKHRLRNRQQRMRTRHRVWKCAPPSPIASAASHRYQRQAAETPSSLPASRIAIEGSASLSLVVGIIIDKIGVTAAAPYMRLHPGVGVTLADGH